VRGCNLIIPYDEFICLQHVFFEASVDSPSYVVDMFYYFELLLRDFTNNAQVRTNALRARVCMRARVCVCMCACMHACAHACMCWFVGMQVADACNAMP
jgi:hypothetical protein